MNLLSNFGEWIAKFLMGLVLGAASIMTWVKLQDYDMSHLKSRVQVVESKQADQEKVIGKVKEDTAVIRAILEERKEKGR